MGLLPGDGLLWALCLVQVPDAVCWEGSEVSRGDWAAGRAGGWLFGGGGAWQCPGGVGAGCL